MLVKVTRTSNRDMCILGAPFAEERTNIRPLARGLMNCHPLPDEVIYRIAAILHQHGEEGSGS